MKKLLNTLYVLSEDNYLTLDGENVVVVNDKQTLARYPLHTLENIVSFSYKGASPALMGACGEHNIGLSFFSPYGKFLSRCIGKEYGNVLLRKEQYYISEREELSHLFARNMILGKVYNCRWSLERTVRDYPYRVDVEKIKAISQELKEGLNKIKDCNALSELRGIEGELATRYFSVFDDLIINQKDDFRFLTRNRRPPKDMVNALLSFAYAILANECGNALASVGLDPYVGFMHRDRPGRKSLALDLIEELRGVLADRFILTLINTKVIQSCHFEKGSNDAVLLNQQGRKQFFTAWQTKKREQLTHPFLKEKIEWGLVPYVQAMLLARTLRGDLDEYPPFLWK